MKAQWTKLLDTPLLFVTGKGGTGKSTLALALGHESATQGKRVLVAEMCTGKHFERSRFHLLFRDAPFKHIPETFLAPNTSQKLWGCALQPHLAMQEYLAMKLPGGKILKYFLSNETISAFLSAVPSLPALVFLGKLWHMLARLKEFDQIIVDCPSSGHFLELLTTPQRFDKMARKAPILSENSALIAFLQNSEATKILQCACPEELVVNETVEFRAKLKSAGFTSTILVNRVIPLSAFEDSNSTSAQFLSNRKSTQKNAMQQMNSELQISYYLSETNNPVYLQVSRFIHANIH